jgi:AcrR family transcriptional regulator
VEAEQERRDALGVAEIREAALRVVQTTGLQSLSMRRLATELEVWPTSIYHHVGDKADLIQLVLDGVLAQLDRPSPELGWQDWMRTLATNTRALLLRYPGVADHLQIAGNSSRPAWELTDQAVGKLLEAGFTAEHAAVIWVDVFSFVVARVRREEAIGSVIPSQVDAYREQLGLVQSMADDLTSVAAAAEYWLTLPPAEYLTRGIEMLLTGAAALLEQT